MTKKGKYVMTAVLGAAAGIAAEETTIGKELHSVENIKGF